MKHRPDCPVYGDTPEDDVPCTCRITRGEELTKMQKVCSLISDDIENDARSLDSMAFNGRTMGTLMGKQMAAVQALTNIVKEMLEDLK